VVRPVGAHESKRIGETSGADVFQTRSVSLLRFSRRLDVLEPDQVDEIAEAVAYVVGAL
jgi:mRNA-degrading endonuclease toxin of MazEF toxin-antitoxin module